jgi:hypothetical protein
MIKDQQPTTIPCKYCKTPTSMLGTENPREPMKYLTFDIEIAKTLPEGESDWKAHRPLGITCAAAASSDGGLWNWWAQDPYGRFTSKMTENQCQDVVNSLLMLAEDYTILTWNGLGFDFNALGEEANFPHIEGMMPELQKCKALALNHIDMMFHFFASKGFPLGLDAAAKGMDLPRKPPRKSEGITGANAPKIWANGEYHRVLDHVSWDAKNILMLAEAVDNAGHLNWTARNGPNSWDCQKWLTVKEAMALPEPDTSWMSDPRPRSKFYEWTGYKPILPSKPLGDLISRYKQENPTGKQF